MKKKIHEAIRIMAGVLIGIIALVAVTWLLAKTLANGDPRYSGHTIDYWSAQVVAADSATSNRANAILNEKIIPQLTDRMFHDTNDSKFVLTAVNSLEYLQWVRYIDHRQAPDRRTLAASDLGAFGPAAKAAIPALMQAVQGSDPAVHEAAITSLGKIRSQPDVVIPFLMKYLDDDNLDDEAATALANFGSLARVAVPKIIPLLHANDDDAVAAARDALKQIDPAALTNALSEPQKETAK